MLKVRFVKSLLKDIFFFTVNLLSPSLRRKGSSILVYHSVSSSPAFFVVKPKDFDKQLAYIARKKFSVVKLSELVNKMRNGQSIAGHVVITFDDGYRDNYETVFPLLKKYNLSASIFIATGFIGGSMTVSGGAELPIMTPEQIKEMTQSGLIEVLPHTAGHIILDKADIKVASKDIESSMSHIKILLGSCEPILAYPKGRYTEEVVSFLRSNEWLAAVTVEEGITKENDNLFRLKRNSVDSATSFAQFKGKLSGAIDIYAKMKTYAGY